MTLRYSRSGLSLLGGTTLMAGALVAFAPAADARAAFQGDDFALHNNSATWLTVCDEERDGHAVWARYNTIPDHSAPHPKLNVDYDDPDKCGQLYVPDTLYNFRVVEDKPGTSKNLLGRWHGYPVLNN